MNCGERSLSERQREFRASAGFEAQGLVTVYGLSIHEVKVLTGYMYVYVLYVHLIQRNKYPLTCMDFREHNGCSGANLVSEGVSTIFFFGGGNAFHCSDVVHLQTPICSLTAELVF